MGKAIVIGVTVILIVLAAVVLVIWMRRQESKDEARKQGLPERGDLSRHQEKILQAQLEHAAAIMRKLTHPTMDLEASFLTQGDRTLVEKWLDNYEERRRV